jgi:hypothetical protein
LDDVNLDAEKALALERSRSEIATTIGAAVLLVKSLAPRKSGVKVCAFCLFYPNLSSHSPSVRGSRGRGKE